MPLRCVGNHSERSATWQGGQSGHKDYVWKVPGKREVSWVGSAALSDAEHHQHGASLSQCGESLLLSQLAQDK